MKRGREIQERRGISVLCDLPCCVRTKAIHGASQAQEAAHPRAAAAGLRRNNALPRQRGMRDRWREVLQQL